MAKAWTSKEQKSCCDLYSAGGLPLARKSLNRSDNSIISRMCKLGVKSPLVVQGNINPAVNGRWYAEDIAIIFEMIAADINTSIIAEYFNSTKRNIDKVLYRARKYGFDAYPLRNSQ